MIGYIDSLNDRGFFFIAGQEGQRYFAHRSDTSEFYDLREGDQVEFEPVSPTPEKGPRAASVRRTSTATVSPAGEASNGETA